jgi:RimJ/RimL family protein N-acetyltransferase
MSRLARPISGVLAIGKRVYLRRPGLRDSTAFLEFVRVSRDYHRPWVSPPADSESFASYLQRNRSDRFLGMLVCARADHAIVGVINLSEIVGGAFRSAYLGFYGHASHAGTGAMTEALRLAVTFSFQTLRLHRLEANVQPGNTRSIALVRRCGFGLEGFSPRYLKIGGRWRDHERWAILSDAPTAPIPAPGCAREGVVVAVSRSATHTLAKWNQESVKLVAGLGVEDDAHAGGTIKHRSRVARDASEPNLRQVHLIHAELQDELRASGFAVSAGQMGENITTRGVDLLALPAGARLRLGVTAVVEVTGLRTPCAQLDTIQPGLMAAVMPRDENGVIARKSGVMSIVLASGEVHPGDPIRVDLPPEPRRPLGPV